MASPLALFEKLGLVRAVGVPFFQYFAMSLVPSDSLPAAYTSFPNTNMLHNMAFCVPFVSVNVCIY